MSRRSEPNKEPTDGQVARVKEIWQRVAESFHAIEDDEQAIAKGLTQEEHARRHGLFAWAFLIGMEYALTHPNRAARMYRAKLAAGDQEDKPVDIIAEHLLHLFPRQDNPNLILGLKEVYETQSATDALPIKPEFDERGRLVWADTHGEAPFPWAWELESWEDSSE